RRLEEVEAERPATTRQRFELASRFCSLFLEATDLRELGLRLLRLRLLVAEASDEAIEPCDVNRHAVGGLFRRGRPRCLLASPLVPRPGEVVHTARGQLEHGRRDRLEKPAVAGDEDDGGAERLELTLEPPE